MRKLLVGLVAVLSLSLVTSQVSVAAVKPGTKCSKAGATSTSNGKKYTCIKSGKKLVWNKGVAIAKLRPAVTPIPTPTLASIDAPEVTALPSPTPTVKFLNPKEIYSTDDGYIDDINGPCAVDPRIPEEWDRVFPFQIRDRCKGIVRLGKYSLGEKRPSTTYESAEKFGNLNQCKLVTPTNSRSGLGWTTTQSGRNEWRELRRYPSPKTVIQLIPLYSLDSEVPKSSPLEDYGKYLDFIKNWIEYSSDNGSQVEVRVPSKYLDFKLRLSEYDVVHTNNHDDPEHVRLNRDIVNAVDSFIDFTGVNIVIVVPTSGSKSTVLQQGALGPMKTAEGTIGVTSSQYADMMTEPNLAEFSNLAAPFWWLHELFHVGFGLDDHYGDTKRDINGEYGMGWWSLMTPWGGDLTSYEKWLLGFIGDSQVQCLTSVSSTQHWLIPTTVQSGLSKSLMIPISSTKLIIAESIRPAGLFYKIPQKKQGVLVYELDLMKDSHGMGMKLVLPKTRSISNDPFFLADAPLKVGDFVVADGIRVSVVESGTFGDVIKVEKS
jgi:M6 family metalloprotease-like protein